MTSAREDATNSFPTGIAQHRLDVLRADGVYRHLRFRRPDTCNMSFDILTWPGYLAYVGDMGDYVFQRTEDMLEFFRQKQIDPRYWGEKVQASCRDGIREYDADLARARIAKHLDDCEASDEVRAEAADLEYDDGEHHLRQQLRDGDFGGIFHDQGEISFQDYTYRFIWCCLAIQWAVKQFDQWTDAQAAAQAERLGMVPHG